MVVIDMLDTRRDKDLLGTFISDIVLQLLSYVAEQERTFIKQRQREGIAAAKKRGVKFGRPPKEAPPDFAEIVEQWNNKEITQAEISKKLGMSQTTFYRRMREYQASRQKRK